VGLFLGVVVFGVRYYFLVKGLCWLVMMGYYIIDVRKNYTHLNTHELMKLKKKHLLRLLPILHKIKINIRNDCRE
jgi:hypothetical protein